MFSLSFDIFSFSQQINENGFTVFVSGILLTLSMYHIMLFFQHRDKAYLYYSLYTFFVLLHSYYRVDNFFIKELMDTYTPYVKFLHASIKWIYSTLYLLFAISFIDLKKYNYKWNQRINITIQISLFFIVISAIASLIYDDQRITEYPFNFVFVPILLFLSILILVLFKDAKVKSKNYLLVGFSVFFIFSFATQALAFMGYSYRIIFYSGIVIETTLFALGLGAKQRNLLLEKNKALRIVVEEQQNNIDLQEQIKIKLDTEVSEKTKEIIAINNKKEKEQQEKMALAFSRKTLNLRMRALQTQMNPHFLFNSLNSIKHFIIKNEKEDASFFLSKLSQLIRKILDNSKLREITLAEELKIMQLYLEVENIRLNNSVSLKIIIKESVNLKDYKIPPMVLQPFIENAIWHGLALKKGVKNITISIDKIKETLQICIEDNGIGREKAAVIKEGRLVKKQSLGIDLTRQRLRAYTEHLSNNVIIKFIDLYNTKNEPTGTKVCIEIPIIS